VCAPELKIMVRSKSVIWEVKIWKKMEMWIFFERMKKNEDGEYGFE